MSDQDPATPATPRLNFGAAAQQVEVPAANQMVSETAATNEEALEQFNALAERQAQATVETEQVETQDVSVTAAEEIGNVGEPEAATEQDTPVAEETPSETAIGVDSDDGSETYGDEPHIDVGADKLAALRDPAFNVQDAYDEATAQSHEPQTEAELIEASGQAIAEEEATEEQLRKIELELEDETQEVEQAEPLTEEPAADEPEPEAEAPVAVPSEEADAVVAEEPVEAVTDADEPVDEQPDASVVEAEADASEDASGDGEAVPAGAPVTEEVEVVTGQAKTQEELEAEAIELHRQKHADEATERLHNTEVGPSIEELREQEANLQAQIKAKQDAEKESVLSQIKTVVTTYGITTEDLVNYLGGYKPKRPGVKAVQKYKDPVSGATWSGRGKAPTWIKGQDYNKFLTTQP